MGYKEQAFEKVKKLVTSAPLLAYYKGSEDLILQKDASSTGLVTVLMQNGKPITFASRTLLPAESRYAQIEKEMWYFDYRSYTHLVERFLWRLTTNRWKRLLANHSIVQKINYKT